MKSKVVVVVAIAVAVVAHGYVKDVVIQAGKVDVKEEEEEEEL